MAAVIVDTLCNNCCLEVPKAERQQCALCQASGLGNCCIGEEDHDCKGEPA